MHVIDNVERIPAPPADVFHRKYVLERRPVILTDLFDDQPIRAIDTATKARERLADLPVAVQPNYMTALLAQGRTDEPEQTSLGAFLDHLQRDPSSDDYCVEYPTPPAMQELIAPTGHCRLVDESDLLSLMFVAAPGNFAQLHYDRDQRHVLMYQAFGRKRYVIIDPREGRKVAPLAERGIQRTSAILVQNFTEDDKRAFLEYTNAWNCVLEPGETLFMPIMAWHYIEYQDTSMSVSYRLGRNRYNRFLAESVPIPSVFLQRLSLEFANAAAVDTARRDVFDLIQEAAAARHPSEEARARALDRLCMEACDRLDPEGSRIYTTMDRRRREQLAAEPAATTNGAGPAPTWRDEDPVALAPDVMVVEPLSDEGAAARSVLLLRRGRLDMGLTIDEPMQWLFDALKILSSSGAPLTISALCERCGVEPATVRHVFNQLHERGWVTAGGR